MRRMGSTIAILCIFLTAGTAMEAAPAYSSSVQQIDSNMNASSQTVPVSNLKTDGKIIGYVQESRLERFENAPETDDEFISSINAAVWANLEKFETACGKDNKEIAYNMIYDDFKFTPERADDGSGTSDSVKVSYNLKTIVAMIHNHPSVDKNYPAGRSLAWPSMTDVFSLIWVNKERDEVLRDKRIPSKVDTYIVDCFDKKSVVRVDGRTGAVKNVKRNGEYNPESYNGLRIQKCNDADDCGKSLKEIKSEEDLRNFRKKYERSAYNPDFFDQMRKLVAQFPNALTDDDNVVGRIDIGDEDRAPTGVRGWCHCFEKEQVSSKTVYVGLESCPDAMYFKGLYGIEQSCDGDYAYRLCLRCGRCSTSRKPGEEFDFAGHEIMSLRIYRQWNDKAGSEIPTHQYLKLLREARDELLKIPDGGIVIPGECHCKYPDPVKVNVISYHDEFFVCCFCGRVRLPDEVGGIPMGPTQWRIVKGEDKPFPGFNNEKK